jgi:hypothetical protein
VCSRWTRQVNRVKVIKQVEEVQIPTSGWRRALLSRYCRLLLFTLLKRTVYAFTVSQLSIQNPVQGG